MKGWHKLTLAVLLVAGATVGVMRMLDARQARQLQAATPPKVAAVLERAGAGYIPPGDYPMSIVVIGGSQGARILSDVVPAAIAMLPEELRQYLRVAQQARPEDLERVMSAYDEAGIQAEVEPFFADVPRRFSEAQLVIARAGASTVADLTVIGRPAILVPFGL